MTVTSRQMMRQTAMTAKPSILRTLSGQWLALALCLPVIASCDLLTRFHQELYKCPLNPTGIIEVDFRAFKIGDDANLFFTDKTVTANIIESTDDALSVQKDDLIVRVDRNSGIVRLTRDSRFTNVRCTKAVFKM